MSNLTRIIMIGGPFILDSQMEEINNYLLEKHHGEFKRVDNYANGERPFVEDVWMGCFNYLNLTDFLNFFVKHTQNECVFIIRREHDNSYWMCKAQKEYLPNMPPETGI